MKKLFTIILIITLASCKKEVSENIIKNESNISFDKKLDTAYCNFECVLNRENELSYYSKINRTTSWVKNNKSFDKLFPLMDSLPFESWNKMFGYQPDLGGYIYTDLNNDNKKDLFVVYHKSPWPTNQIGLNLFVEYQKNKSSLDIQKGLTQIRKLSLADLTNDGMDEIVCFSSGYDKDPFPGDSIQIFYPKDKKYKYLSEDIGYFHTGATGDINNDGLVDILAFSGNSSVIKTHATCYINRGNDNYILKNDIFPTIRNGFDNFYTMELFDINNDGWLDLILAGEDKIVILYNTNGVFDKRTDLILRNNISGLDIGFLDLDNNGKIDLIVNSQILNYNGYNITTLLQYDNNSFVDKTSSYFNQFEEISNGTWIKWLRFFDYDKDGDIDIVGDGLYGTLLNKKIWWKNDNNKFTKSN
jgi:hypothetical protein